MTTNSAIEKEFSNLRIKLEALGYKQPLGIESVPLVETMLNEVIKTAEAFEKRSNEIGKVKEQLKKEKASILPLKNENMRLVEENNDLHKELIKLKEIQDNHEFAISEAVSKLNAEKEEIRYLLLQKEQKMKITESEKNKLQKKLNEVISKVYGDQSKVGLTGSDKILNVDKSSTNILGSKAEFNLSGVLSEAHFSREFLDRQTVSKDAWAKEMSKQDDIFEQLDKEKRKLEKRLEQSLKKLELVEQQKVKLEIEVRRVMESYNVNERMDEMRMKYDNDSQGAQIEKLNSQIDFLNRENHELRKQIDFGEKRCTPSEVSKLDKMIAQLRKEKEKLKNEILKKDEQINSKKIKGTPEKTFVDEVLF